MSSEAIEPTRVKGELSNRTLTLAYVFALSVIALMSLGSHLTLHRILSEHEGGASVINVSGRQRMLSQRMASFAAQMALGVPDARRGLLQATEEFETAHHYLIVGDTSLELPAATSPDLKAVYFGGAHPLDPAVADFIVRARRIADIAPSDLARSDDLSKFLEQAREPLLTDLNRVVSVHQADSERQLNILEWMQTASLIVVLFTLVGEALIVFRPMAMRMARYTGALRTLAATDYLTNALNRRSFTERATAELSRVKRHGGQAAILTLDADRFKAINDRHGHAAGDDVLKALAACIAKTLRPSDLFGRIGGEEFAVLLAETGLAGGEIAAERLRANVAKIVVRTGKKEIGLTVSIGVSAFEQADETIEPAMERADMALYRAKALGRNRVVVAADDINEIDQGNDQDVPPLRPRSAA